MEAEPYTDPNGNVEPVTDIQIGQLDYTDNTVEQPYDPTNAVPQGLTLYSAEPGEAYGVNVTWADGSSYATTVGVDPGGNLLDVTNPNLPPPDPNAPPQDPNQLFKK